MGQAQTRQVCDMRDEIKVMNLPGRVPQPHQLARLTVEVIGTVGFEEGFGGEVAVIGREGVGFPVPHPDRAVTFVLFGRQALILGLLQEKPCLGRIVIGIGRPEISPVPVEMIQQGIPVAPGFGCGRHRINRFSGRR